MSVSMLCFCSIFALFTIFVQARLEECVEFTNSQEEGAKVNLTIFRDSAVLPHFYEDSGPCKEFIHADSVKVNGVCNNLDFHPHIYSEMKECEELHGRGNLEFRKCVWNADTVIEGGVVDTIGAIPGADVFLELYDKMDCDKFISSDTLTVKDSEPEPESETLLSQCMTIEKPQGSEDVVGTILRDEKVFPSLYNHLGGCGRLVRTRSISVNGLCVNHSFYTAGRVHKLNCLEQFTRRTEEFKRCVWNAQTVDESLRINLSTEAGSGETFTVKTFKGNDCTDVILEGNLMVQSETV